MLLSTSRLVPAALMAALIGVASAAQGGPAAPGEQATAAAAERRIELLMVDRRACEWCERWDEEIAPVYPKTAEGKAAPLRRTDLYDPLPSDVTVARRIGFTPTFILLEDGREVGRIEGYPGEDFFWPLLAQLLEEAQVEMAAEP